MNISVEHTSALSVCIPSAICIHWVSCHEILLTVYNSRTHYIFHSVLRAMKLSHISRPRFPTQNIIKFAVISLRDIKDWVGKKFFFVNIQALPKSSAEYDTTYIIKSVSHKNELIDAGVLIDMSVWAIYL